MVSKQGEGSTFEVVLPLPSTTGEPTSPPPSLDARAPAAIEPGTMIWPARTELEALQELVSNGNLSAIARRAESLARTDALGPFARRLTELARDFDDVGIEELLAAGLDEG